MRAFILLCFCICFSNNVISQKNLYLGFEFGVSSDQYDVFDTGSELLNTRVLSSSAGATIGFSFTDNLSIETGAILKQYGRGYNFGGLESRTGFISSAMHTLQIPVRIRARFPVVKDRLFLTGVMGYHRCYNLYNSESFGSIGSSGGAFLLDADEKYSGNLVQGFHLLETGIGLEYRIFKNVFLTFNASYFTGFKTVAQSDLAYSVNDEPVSRGTYRSNGSYASYNIGVRIPIGTLGGKKK